MQRLKAEHFMRIQPNPAKPSNSGSPASPASDSAPPDGSTSTEGSPEDSSQVDHLIELLETEYDGLRQRLAGALHSTDAATEALHETYLKLDARPAIGPVRQPLSYLYRMAINLAKNHGRHEAFLKLAPVARIDELPDQGPDPERAASGRLEMERAVAALDSLPRQRREIFLARWRDEKLLTEIARDLNIHKRTVQKELARAEHYLRSVLGR